MLHIAVPRILIKKIIIRHFPRACNCHFICGCYTIGQGSVFGEFPFNILSAAVFTTVAAGNNIAICRTRRNTERNTTAYWHPHRQCRGYKHKRQQACCYFSELCSFYHKIIPFKTKKPNRTVCFSAHSLVRRGFCIFSKRTQFSSVCQIAADRHKPVIPFILI